MRTFIETFYQTRISISNEWYFFRSGELGVAPPKMRLECIASWILHAPIQSLAKVRTINSMRDTLVLAFMDAKVSLVDFDTETHDLKTVSLHIFEVCFQIRKM